MCLFPDFNFRLIPTKNDIITAIIYNKPKKLKCILSCCKKNLYNEFVITPIYPLLDNSFPKKYNKYWSGGSSPLLMASKLKNMDIFDELLSYTYNDTYFYAHYASILFILNKKNDSIRADIIRNRISLKKN